MPDPTTKPRQVILRTPPAEVPTLAETTARLDLLDALLQSFTPDDLQLISDMSREVIEQSGFGHLVLKFRDGHFELIEKSSSFKPSLKNRT